jgi:hypothetical protein
MLLYGIVKKFTPHGCNLFHLLDDTRKDNIK